MRINRNRKKSSAPHEKQGLSKVIDNIEVNQKGKFTRFYFIRGLHLVVPPTKEKLRFLLRLSKKVLRLRF